MASDKLFTITGTSRASGIIKCRFTNDPLRVKMLEKDGQTDVLLIELPEPMDKLGAVKFMKDLEEFSSDEQQAAIDDFLERNDPSTKPARVAKTPRAAKPEPEMSLASIRARADDADGYTVEASASDEMEDAPF